MITEMGIPLGRAIGNALEVIEAVADVERAKVRRICMLSAGALRQR